MKARILENNDFGGVYKGDFLSKNLNKVINGGLVSEWNLTDVLPGDNLYKPTWNGTEWIEGFTQQEIDDKLRIEALNYTKQKYELHKTNGWEAYQDFRAKIVLDIENSIITEEQAFEIEANLKVAYDRIAQNGDWKTALYELSQTTLSSSFVQPYYDLAINYISEYITNNYD